MLVGAVIFGLLAGVENIIQGFAIVTAYPDVAKRAKVIHDLASNPALGMFYGDAHANISTPAGYMVYRTGPFIALILGIWGLTAITKWLRGQEDDGRWELLLTGATTARRATGCALIGSGSAVLLAYILSVIIIAGAGTSDKLHVTFSAGLFYGLAIISGAALFVGVGAVTSQLAATRRRAMLYGAAALVIFFVLRGVGNVAPSFAWVKNLTPFGWIDKLHPLTNPQPQWLLPIIILTVTCVLLALYLSGKRDLGESIIADTDSARPRYSLLGSQFGFDFRMNRAVLLAWLVGTVGFSALMAGIAKTAAQSLSDSGGLSKTVNKISGNATGTIELAFLSIAGYFITLLVMFMLTSGIGSIREEESSGRLDNFLAGTAVRSRWLAARLFLLSIASIVICLLASLSIWGIASAQHIRLDAPKLLLGNLNVLGPPFLLLGAGVFLYGYRPQLAKIFMYAWIAWSFTADILASVLNLNKVISNSSLLRQVSLVPVTDPKWSTFAFVALVGLALTLLGIRRFNHRDLVSD
jgi:ABC-2 type transport system permease protein